MHLCMVLAYCVFGFLMQRTKTLWPKHQRPCFTNGTSDQDWIDTSGSSACCMPIFILRYVLTFCRNLIRSHTFVWMGCCLSGCNILHTGEFLKIQEMFDNISDFGVHFLFLWTLCWQVERWLEKIEEMEFKIKAIVKSVIVSIALLVGFKNLRAIVWFQVAGKKVFEFPFSWFFCFPKKSNC